MGYSHGNSRSAMIIMGGGEVLYQDEVINRSTSFMLQSSILNSLSVVMGYKLISHISGFQ